MTSTELLIIELAKKREFTYDELKSTFLAGSRMNWNTNSSELVGWVQIFDKWIVELEKARKNALGLS